jgi:hypothetical protein
MLAMALCGIAAVFFGIIAVGGYTNIMSFQSQPNNLLIEAAGIALFISFASVISRIRIRLKSATSRLNFPFFFWNQRFWRALLG